MIEVYPRLFVGGADDLHYAIPRGSHTPSSPWFVISAAKYPFHRDAIGGYTTRAAPRDHPEYLMAVRDRRLILNLIDAADPAFIPDEIINTAIDTIRDGLAEGSKVLVHCNKGQSRAPTIAMLFMARHTDEFAGMDYEMASDYFRGIYPSYAPAQGMALYAKAHWPIQEVKT